MIGALSFEALESICLPNCTIGLRGGGGEKKFTPVGEISTQLGGGQVSRLKKKKHPKLKKFPVGWGVLGTAVGVEKLHVSGAGHELSFFVIQSSASGIANKLEPEFLSVRLLWEGATLARKPFKAQRPDRDMRVIQVDEKDMPHAMQKLGLQGAQCYFHQGRTQGKVMDKQPPLNTQVFYAPLTGVRLQKFFGEYGGTGHFSLMTLDEYHSRGLQKSALVCQVFYKKNMKDKHARTLWYTLYQALLQALAELSRWSLSVRGYNKMCFAFHEENDAAEFFKVAAVELRSKGLLFKDERTKQWIKDPPLQL